MLSGQKPVWALFLIIIIIIRNIYIFEPPKGQDKVIVLLPATGLNPGWSDLCGNYIFSQEFN